MKRKHMRVSSLPPMNMTTRDHSYKIYGLDTLREDYETASFLKRTNCNDMVNQCDCLCRGKRPEQVKKQFISVLDENLSRMDGGAPLTAAIDD